MQHARWILVSTLALAALHGCDSGGFRRTQAQARVAAEVSLGRPFVGDRAEATFPVTAVGDGAIRVVRVSTTHPQLVLDWGQHSGRDTVSRGGTVDVKVSWTPTEATTLDATLEVELDLEDEPIHTVHVTGESRAIPSCDDGNPCTDDAFDRAADRCVHSDHEGSCDDGNACTEDDQCSAGVCRGVAKTCNDDNVCTLDLCDPTSGCVFPPDGRQCDDQDPCTTDVCDPDDGCSHPDAPNGTACGDFSCATAHVCIVGTCRELDITDSSDGFPCSDGNACTEGDQCLAGQCQSGPPRPDTGPVIVSTIDTFGGSNAYAVTDGYRYLFVDRLTTFSANQQRADPSSLRVTLFDGQTLVPHGALPVAATAPPVTVAPGLFAVPVIDKILLIDARNPDAPTVALELPALAAERVNSVKLVMLQGILAAQFNWQELPGGPQRSYLVTASMADPFHPGPWQTIFDDEMIDDLDGDGAAIVLSSARGVYWLLVGANGQVAENQYLAPPSSVRLSVQDRLVAILSTQNILLVKADLGAKVLATIPADQLNDVALVGTNLFATGAQGTWGRTLESILHPMSENPVIPAVDPMSGYTLERAGGHIILRGDIALPLRLTGGSTTEVPQLTRVTGVGHGSLSVITDSSKQKLLAGGHTALASIDTRTHTFSSWTLLNHSPDRAEASMIKGANRTESIDWRVWVSDGALSTCDGPVWSRYDASAQREEFKLCGLMGGSVTVAQNRVWATTVVSRPKPGDTAYDEYGLRVWNLNPVASSPVFELTDASLSESASVRASQDQKYVGWASDLLYVDPSRPVIQRMRLYRSDTTNFVPVGEFVFEENNSYVSSFPEEYAVTSDAALTAGDGVVRLHPLAPLSNGLPPTAPDGTLPSVQLANAHPSNRVLSMAEGRAWVGWEKRPSQTDPRFRLSQLRYDVSKNTLESLGDVAMPGMALSTHQAGDYTLVTTPTAVVVVAPSCR
jgi:hypothetical protein